MNKRLFKQKEINSYIVLGVILLCVPIIVSVIGEWMILIDPLETNTAIRLSAPGPEHIFGTDDVGRDVFARTLKGIRVSLLIGVLVTCISAAAGIVAGIIAAYYPTMSKVIMRIVDGIMAFPSIILAIALAGVLGAGTRNIVVALSISYFPMITRVVRNAVLEVTGKEYVESVIVLGKSDLHIIIHHIVPNIVSPIMVQVTFTFAMAILHESILSFLGVGIKVPTPSLGGMVSDGRNYISTAPWIIVFPGLTISWIVLALNMLGDGLREVLDPRRKSRG